MTTYGQSSRTLGKIEVMDASLENVLAKDAKIEVLADGFTWTEGPVWIGGAKDGHLLFSDIPAIASSNGLHRKVSNCS